MARQLDPDRLAGTMRSKLAGVIDSESYRDRQQTRASGRELDAQIQQSSGYHPAQKRAGRTFAEDFTPEMNERKAKGFPEPDALRTPLSGRQQDQRTALKTRARSSWTDAQHRAVSQAVGSEDDSLWRELNDELSEHTGDRTQLSERSRVVAGQLDWAIQKYEQFNDRNHVVYCTVEMPGYVNRTNIDGHIRNQYRDGDVVDFDRYTLAAHTMHEVERGDDSRAVVFEIMTRRGAYLGQSRSVDNTAHLLPRGMHLTVLGTHRARYRRKDGTIGERVVVRVTDHTSENEERTDG